ncbi:MAG: CBS domain-containing protein [Candidatus Enteromonas sp.]
MATVTLPDITILSLLVPKAQVAFVHRNDTVRQVLEKMSYHRFEQIPVLDEEGHYVDSVALGDLLFYLVNNQLNYNLINHIPLCDIPRNRNVCPLPISTPLKALIPYLVEQNYVPMVDDKGIFIGTITRKAVFTTLFPQDAQNEPK